LLVSLIRECSFLGPTTVRCHGPTLAIISGRAWARVPGAAKGAQTLAHMPLVGSAGADRTARRRVGQWAVGDAGPPEDALYGPAEPDNGGAACRQRAHDRQGVATRLPVVFVVVEDVHEDAVLWGDVRGPQRLVQRPGGEATVLPTHVQANGAAAAPLADEH